MNDRLPHHVRPVRSHEGREVPLKAAIQKFVGRE